MNERLTSDCYKLVEPQPLPQPTDLPDDWLVKLGEFMATAQGYDLKDTNMLVMFLNKTAGTSSDYPCKEGLSELLKIIYQGYASEGDGAFNNELKRAITAQIYEVENTSCNEGFHDRVLAVISGLTFNESMDGFLSQIREGIVETAARKFTNEVHTHNRFFTAAFEQGYGINPININDKYTRPEFAEDILALLKESFDKDYQPLSILYKLTDLIKGRLGETYSYHGKDESAEGYDCGDYTNFYGLLNRVIGEDDTRYLILDEESRAVDLNWPLIKLRLLSTLCDKGYFNFTSSEEAALMGLLVTTDEEYNQPIHLEPLYTGSDPLIKNRTDLLKLISYIDPESYEIKRDCINNYLNTLQAPMDIGQEIIQLLETPHSIIPKTIKNRLLEDYANDFLMKVKQLGSQYLLITIKRFPIAIPLLMRSINALPSHEKLTLLSEALMQTVQYHPEAIPALIKQMEKLPPQDKLSILSKRDSNGYNALMLAAKYSPTAVNAILEANPARTHTFEVKTEIPALKRYTGTFLKNKILCLLADEINECSTLEDLKRFKNLIKNRDEYQILKTGQDRTTRFFHLKTSSIEKLEQLIGLKQEKLANEPLNPRARA